MGDMRWRKEVLPLAAMVTMECSNVGLNTLFKAATERGMSNYVFVVYAYAVAALLLLPSPFFSHRGTSQIMGYTGINYASPILASAMSNLAPAFTFLFAIIFRMEKLAIRSSTGRAKVLGTVASITGAFVITLYKGPKIKFNSSSPSTSHHHSLQSLSNWIIGSLFLTVQYILAPMGCILQAQIMKEYPAELTVVFFYNLCVSILAAIVGAFAEPNINAWRIRFDISLASILCSGIFGSFLYNATETWAIHLKGPVYVSMFKPLSIAIAVAMGVMFLGDTLYLGSIIGATIISIGFYTVMWGKSKEDFAESNDLESSTSISPLLRGYNDQDTNSKQIEGLKMYTVRDLYRSMGRNWLLEDEFSYSLDPRVRYSSRSVARMREEYTYRVNQSEVMVDGCRQYNIPIVHQLARTMPTDTPHNLQMALHRYREENNRMQIRIF